MATFVMLLVIEDPEDFVAAGAKIQRLVGEHVDRIMVATEETAERVIESCRVEGEPKR